MQTKSVLLTVVKIGVVGGILFYLVKSGRLNFERLLLFQESPLTLLLLVGTLAFVVVPLASLRWWLLLRAVDLEIPPLRAFFLTWIGNFFNVTLPGAISGDVVKGYYVLKVQKGEGRTRAFMTLLIDRFVGLFGLIVMAFAALVLNYAFVMEQKALHNLAFAIIGLFAGTLLFYAVALFPFKEGKDPFLRLLGKLPARDFTTKVYLAFKRYQNEKKTLAATLAIAISIHSCIAVLFFQITQLIGVEGLNLGTQFFLMPIGLITIAIPLAPGGVGIGHAAFESLYQLVGVSGGADIFNLFVIVQLAVFLLGGIPYFFYSHDYEVPEEMSSIETSQNIT